MKLKKGPLFCLLRGDPETSTFPVHYIKSQTIAELREVIEKKIEADNYVRAKDLILYQVDIDLITTNPKRTALKRNFNIMTDLVGQVLSPVDTVGEKFSAPAKKHIHIIVDW